MRSQELRIERRCPHCNCTFTEGWRIACPYDGRILAVVNKEPDETPAPDDA